MIFSLSLYRHQGIGIQINNLIHLISLNREGAVLMEFSLNLLLGDVEKSTATTGAAISVACEGDALLQELLDCNAGHVWLVKGIEVACHEHTTRSTGRILTFGLESELVDRVDLEALIWVPAGTNHTGAQTVPIVVNHFTHDAGG